MTDLNKDLDFQIALDSNRAKQDALVKSGGAEEVGYNKDVIGYSQDLAQDNQQGGSLSLSKGTYDLNQAGHPIICICTFGFKLAAVITYFIVGLFISSILTFIIVVVLSSIDFWIVKNISGRLLVGLRWRSAYDDSGKQVWKFDSSDEKFVANKVDKFFFWASQVAFTVVWAIFLLLNILTLDVFWGLLVFVACGLCATNLYGYYQCRGDHQKKMKDLKKQYGSKVIQQVANRVL